MTIKKVLKKFIGALLKLTGFSFIRVNDKIKNCLSKENFVEYEEMEKQIIQSSLKYKSIDDFFSIYPIVKNNTMVPFENLASLFDIVNFLETNQVEGDFVECGVWKGGSVAVMALGNIKYGTERRNLHLFDAFDDICQPNPDVDGERAMEDVKKYSNIALEEIKGDLVPIKGIYDSFGGHGTKVECEYLLIDKIKYSSEKIFIHKGWFQDTLPQFEYKINKISLLRLDGDWYESTKICLEYLFDKVIYGGFVVIDDYGAYTGCKKAVDEFLVNQGIKRYLINSSSSNGECFYFIK